MPVLRRKLFAVLAEAALALVFLLAGEGILRCFGVLDSPVPFVLSPDGGSYVGNSDWHTKWDSSEPYPKRAVFAANKEPGTFRIFCIGGSPLLGFPFQDEVSVPTRIQEVLSQRLPGGKFEVVNAAVGGISSGCVQEFVAAAVAHEADLIVLYTGNNEFLLQNTVEVARKKSRPLEWYLEAGLRNLRLARALATLKWTPSKLADEASLLGGDLRKRHVISRTPWGEGRVSKDIILAQFKENLEEVVSSLEEYISRKKLHLVVCVPATSCVLEPSYSVFQASTSEAEAEQWEDLLRAGEALAEAGDVRRALEKYRRAEALDPAPAILHFRMGEALRTLGDQEGARRRFEEAVDADECPPKCNRALREAIRALAGREGVIVADIDRALEEALGGLLVDDDHLLLFDNTHFTPAGSRLAAKTIVDAMAAAGVPAPSSDFEPYLEPDSSEREADAALTREAIKSNAREQTVKKFSNLLLQFAGLTEEAWAEGSILNRVERRFRDLEADHPDLPHGKVGLALIAACRGDCEEGRRLFQEAAPREEADAVLTEVEKFFPDLARRLRGPEDASGSSAAPRDGRDSGNPEREPAVH